VSIPNLVCARTGFMLEVGEMTRSHDVHDRHGMIAALERDGGRGRWLGMHGYSHAVLVFMGILRLRHWRRCLRLAHGTTLCRARCLHARRAVERGRSVVPICCSDVSNSEPTTSLDHSTCVSMPASAAGYNCSTTL
jgi:hypothetical protein